MVVTEERLSKLGRIDRERIWMRRLGLAWVGAIVALIVLEPTPTNADAREPLWALVAGYTFLSALVAMMVGIRRHRRWIYGVSGFAGVLGMFLAYACLQSGHHLGAWWMIELGVFGGLTALSITAAERSKS